MKYTEEEMDLIDEMYVGNGNKADCTYQNIADECNRTLYNGKPVRTKNSVYYIITKIYGLDKK